MVDKEILNLADAIGEQKTREAEIAQQMKLIACLIGKGGEPLNLWWRALKKNGEPTPCEHACYGVAAAVLEIQGGLELAAKRLQSQAFPQIFAEYFPPEKLREINAKYINRLN